jgi:hypothetical protein
MIEVISECHFSARAEAMSQNSNRAVYLVACFRLDGTGPLRFVFRTSATGGAN